MKKLSLLVMLSLIFLFTCNSTCCNNTYHLTLYQNNTPVKEFDEVTNLYSDAGVTTFFYQGKKYKFHMDYFAEPLERK